MRISKTLLVSLTILLVAIISFISGIQYQKNLTSNSSSQYTQATPTSQLPLVGTVTRIVDGDTLELDSGKTVRFIGTNTPETSQPFHDEATAFTSNLVLGKQVKFEYEKGYERDKFGRVLAYVFIGDKNLSIELVKSGLARVSIYEKRRKLIYQDQLLEAQAQAQEKKIGVWQ